MAEVHCLYGEETHEDVAYDVQAAQHRSDGEHPVTLIDTALIPGGGQLLLLKCGDDFSIQYNAEELMGSVDHVSEQALAVLTTNTRWSVWITPRMGPNILLMRKSNSRKARWLRTA